MPCLPPRFAAVIPAFAPLFFQRSWRHAEVLLTGAILAPGKRTVTSLLHIMRLAREQRFVNCHRVLNLGITSDTAAFAVQSIRRWWRELGQVRYPGAKQLQRNPKNLRVITADCGGGVRVRLWKARLQTLADQAGLSITAAHLPPNAGKWNRVGRRLFAFITRNWRGKPLLTHQVIVQTDCQHHHADPGLFNAVKQRAF